jgi:hypothetical protein
MPAPVGQTQAEIHKHPGRRPGCRANRPWFWGKGLLRPSRSVAAIIKLSRPQKFLSVGPGDPLGLRPQVHIQRASRSDNDKASPSFVSERARFNPSEFLLRHENAFHRFHGPRFAFRAKSLAFVHTDIMRPEHLCSATWKSESPSPWDCRWGKFAGEESFALRLHLALEALSSSPTLPAANLGGHLARTI